MVYYVEMIVFVMRLMDVVHSYCPKGVSSV